MTKSLPEERARIEAAVKAAAEKLEQAGPGPTITATFEKIAVSEKLGQRHSVAKPEVEVIEVSLIHINHVMITS